VGVVVLFAVLACAYTWPLAWDLGGTFVHPPGAVGMLGEADSLLTSWIVTWVAHALRTHPLGLFDANALHPLHGVLAFSEHLIAGGALVLPLDVVASNPVRNNNALLLATFVIGGAGTAWLVRELGGSVAAALAAGVLAFFGPLRLSQIGHVHALSLHWLPVAMALLHRTWRTGARRSACGLALASALQALSSVYLAYYSALALALLVVLLWWLGGRPAPGALRRILLAGLAAALVLVPVMLPYARAREVFQLGRDPFEAFMFAARGTTYLGAFLDPIVHLRQRFVDDGWPAAVVGVFLALLAGLGLAAGASRERGGRRAAAVYALLAVAMALVSLGPSMQLRPSVEPGIPGPHALLAWLLPGFDALRVPVRAAGVTVLALAVLAGFGTDAILAYAGPPRRGLVLAGLCLVLVFESWHPRLAVTDAAPLVGRGRSWARWMAAQAGDDAVVELPFGVPDRDAASMVRRASDWRPLVNGYTGFLPAGYFLRRTLAAFPDRRAVDLLAGLGVRWVLVDGDAFARGTRPAPCSAAALPEGVRLAHAGDGGCVLEVVAPAPPPVASRGERVRAAGMVASDGARIALDADGDLAAPWTQAVERDREGWIEVELPAQREIVRVVLDLGPTFGWYLRRYRIEVSDDARTWRVARDEPVGEAPLVAYRRDPDRLAVPIDVPPVRARFVRIVRPAPRATGEPDLALGWSRWGARSLVVWAMPEPATVAAPAAPGG
jgi:hypothetical protein